VLKNSTGPPCTAKPAKSSPAWKSRSTRATLKTLSIAQRHMVAIARALSFDAQVVILDEPTAALSQHEILEFYQIVERLKQDGKRFVYLA
jgi:rhamnose transport system ATP-binding protein